MLRCPDQRQAFPALRLPHAEEGRGRIQRMPAHPEALARRSGSGFRAQWRESQDARGRDGRARGGSSHGVQDAGAATRCSYGSHHPPALFRFERKKDGTARGRCQCGSSHLQSSQRRGGKT